MSSKMGKNCSNHFKTNNVKMINIWASVVAQMVKDPHAMWETWVWSLGWEDPLEKGITTHSTVLAWRIPWTKEPRGYSPWGCKELQTTEQLTLSDFQGDLWLWHAVYSLLFCGAVLRCSKKKRSKRQRRKGKIYPTECRVPKNSKER